jgi:hypothetical protein
MLVPAIVIVSLSLTFAGEKKNDPLAMYAGDIMTVSISFFLSATFLSHTSDFNLC